ncbi:MAG: ATP-binding protein [Acidimicrobiales bacterium]
MQLALAICLPRDGVSIPVARHIIRDALRTVGVAEDCLSDVGVALSEACTNVVQHAGPGDEYELKVEIDDERCVLRVIDKGYGFESSLLTDGADVGAERGRGIQLMRALVDDVHFVSDTDTGTAVHLEKALVFRPDALFRSLSRP